MAKLVYKHAHRLYLLNKLVAHLSFGAQKAEVYSTGQRNRCSSKRASKTLRFYFVTFVTQVISTNLCAGGDSMMTVPALVAKDEIFTETQATRTVRKSTSDSDIGVELRTKYARLSADRTSFALCCI